jgi:hypothetical protein
MEVLTLLLFVSAVWVLGALGLFAWNILHQNHEHAERLAVLPLEDNWIDPRARRIAGCRPALAHGFA